MRRTRLALATSAFLATVVAVASSDRQNALDEYLASPRIATKAYPQGIDGDTRYKKALELMEMKLLSRLVTERHRDSILRNSLVSPAEVKLYYEQHKSELVVVPSFTAHQLLIYVKGNPAFPENGLEDAAARAKAKKALTKLRIGESWEMVAKTYSDEVATNEKGGLIRDGQFGYFAPEVERAVRTQALGKPGEIIKTVFGYHVLQVEQRITERTPKPFEQVKEVVAERLTQQRSAEARKAFMTPIWKEVGFEVTEAGMRDCSLLNDDAVAKDEILAKVGQKSILESDFRWFLKDAFAPAQRPNAYSRPGARQGMLSSFLDMLVLAAKARKDGLDKTAAFVRTRFLEQEKLRFEFKQQRGQVGAP